MKTRQPYTPCKLYCDVPLLNGCRVNEGCFLESETGTAAYFVTGVRQSKTNRLRRHLKCLRWPRDEIPCEGACVHSIRWHPRKKKGRHKAPPLTPL